MTGPAAERHRLAKAGERVRNATSRRDEMIVAAAAVLSQREVARVVGLSHTAVQAILRRNLKETLEEILPDREH